jgi:predicted DNA-binding ribbon-helix-helix protein
MKSAIIKRSIVIGGHKTSISLEEQFWRGLKDICEERGLTLSAQVQSIDAKREAGNLSSAVRLFVLDHYRSEAGRPQIEGVPLAPASNMNAHTTV